MNQEVQKHEKIRFRQDEIASLADYPSAEGQHRLLRWRWALPARVFRSAGLAATTLVAVLVSVITLVILAGATGIGGERLRAEGAGAIERLMGGDVVAHIGSATLSLDPSQLVALEVRDVSVKGPDGSNILAAARMRFGIRFWPLLSGEVQLGSAQVGKARIVAAALPAREGAAWQTGLQGKEGLLDPDKIVELTFSSLRRAFDMLEMGSTRSVSLEDVEVELPEGAPVRRLAVANAELLQRRNGQLSIEVEASVDGRAISVAGTSTRDAVSRRIAAVELSAELTAMDGGVATWGSGISAISATITGSEAADNADAALAVNAHLGGVSVDLKEEGRISGDLDLLLSLAEGSKKVEIGSLVFASGRSRYDFHGAVGPVAKHNAGVPARIYRFELVSDGSRVASESSPEPALEILAKISGTYDPSERRLAAEQIGIRTGGGELLGTGAMEFAAGKAPGIALALSVPEMPVSHVKQLWPWFAAPGARNWVQNNLFGGRVHNSELQYQVPVGRIGNGVPVTHDEVFGTFQIERTRFDVTGRIPPVREADGTVAFRGNDIDISLASGTVFMGSGRSVAARNGRLTIREANRPPVVGSLDIDVEGDASAIAELASYEPIDAMRKVGLSPDEFTSGNVTGHVTADIPLQNGVDTDTLDWLVSLDYRDLSLSRAFDGQIVTGATGNIVVDPQKAVIAAKANLNGTLSQVALVEPLRPTGPDRKRDITMTLDDKSREELVPGLGDLLSGPVKVAFSGGASSAEGETAPQKVSADLTDATLSLPWAGWTKGAGVGANVEFTLERNGDKASLSDFKLSGKSFMVAGDISLSKGALSSATFRTIKLNRDDDLALDVRSSGKGYSVKLSGNSLDARSVVKQFTTDADKVVATAGSVPVTLEANLRRLVGFNGEHLSNVKFSYKGVGNKVLGLDVSGATRSGGDVSVVNTVVDGQRKLRMRSADAGSLLRFLDIYENMEGGVITLDLAGDALGTLRGQVDARNFWVVNEPKLRSIVSTPPQGSGRSLNDAVRRDIDTSRVQFERGFAMVKKGNGSLEIQNGVLRGPLIGTTFQGTLYDAAGRMAMTGTFMPAYGLNRLFGELPFVGVILGNGRDRGLIGVTYRLSGNAKSPNLEINPLSVIAPGIFRSIFEFR